MAKLIEIGRREVKEEREGAEPKEVRRRSGLTSKTIESRVRVEWRRRELRELTVNEWLEWHDEDPKAV